ncbi:MAG TPA: hypothetical protein HA326_07365 [Thermoplasmata archaeon]|nr:hypothetical protein [Thermoplasmata archaeon]
MYGVVVCPRCKRAKGVDLKQKTTACSCGFEIRVVPARVRARASTPRELAPLVGQVNAELAGGAQVVAKALAPPKKARPRDVHARVIAAVPKEGDRASKIRAAARELTNELEVFTKDDWIRVLEGLAIPDPEGALAVLLDANAVFEPRAGFYRAVDLTP